MRQCRTVNRSYLTSALVPIICKISVGIQEKWQIAAESLFSLENREVVNKKIHTRNDLHFRTGQTVQFADAVQCLDAYIVLRREMNYECDNYRDESMNLFINSSASNIPKLFF
jgi:hypothetical protein